MTYIVADVSRMFSELEPYIVSNSIANLGDEAGRLTWQNALRIARERRSWLKSPVREAVAGMCEWARETGAWDEDEISAWSTDECIALFVQNVASELRTYLNVDNQDLKACAEQCATTDWNLESGSPSGNYYLHRGAVRVQYYTGC